MRSGVNPERRHARATSSCSDPFQPRSSALVVSLNQVARVVSNAIVMRSGTATLNRRATGFAAGTFFLLLAAIPNELLTSLLPDSDGIPRGHPKPQANNAGTRHYIRQQEFGSKERRRRKVVQGTPKPRRRRSSGAVLLVGRRLICAALP